jgi:hypothetical protein
VDFVVLTAGSQAVVGGRWLAPAELFLIPSCFGAASRTNAVEHAKKPQKSFLPVAIRVNSLEMNPAQKQFSLAGDSPKKEIPIGRLKGKIPVIPIPHDSFVADSFFTVASSPASSVPDGGSTAVLLSAALCTVVVLRVTVGKGKD